MFEQNLVPRYFEFYSALSNHNTNATIPCNLDFLPNINKMIIRTNLFITISLYFSPDRVFLHNLKILPMKIVCRPVFKNTII